MKCFNHTCKIFPCKKILDLRFYMWVILTLKEEITATIWTLPNNRKRGKAPCGEVVNCIFKIFLPVFQGEESYSGACSCLARDYVSSSVVVRHGYVNKFPPNECKQTLKVQGPSLSKACVLTPHSFLLFPAGWNMDVAATCFNHANGTESLEVA